MKRFGVFLLLFVILLGSGVFAITMESCAPDKSVYNDGETITWSASWTPAYPTVETFRVLIDDDLSFTNCNDVSTTGCIASSDSSSSPGTVQMTASEDVTWYCQVCEAYMGNWWCDDDLPLHLEAQETASEITFQKVSGSAGTYNSDKIDDNDWVTRGTIFACSSVGYFVYHYSKPNGATQAIWESKLGDQNIRWENDTVPTACFNQNPVKMRSGGVLPSDCNLGATQVIECWDGTEWDQIASWAVGPNSAGGRFAFYDARMLWTVAGTPGGTITVNPLELSLISCDINKDEYEENETVTWTASWVRGSGDVRLLVANNDGFRDCDYNIQSGCLAYSDVESGTSTIAEMNASTDTSWYCQVCDDDGCDNNRYASGLFTISSTSPPPEPECQTNSECETGYECIDGNCIEIEGWCNLDSECETGYECVDNSCAMVLECTSTPECAAGYACVDGNCTLIDSCAQDSDCNGLYCGNSTCVSCTADTHCTDGYCSGFQCVKCTVDTHCSADNECINHLCVPWKCDSDIQCSEGEYCSLDGECLAYDDLETQAEEKIEEAKDAIQNATDDGYNVTSAQTYVDLAEDSYDAGEYETAIDYAIIAKVRARSTLFSVDTSELNEEQKEAKIAIETAQAIIDEKDPSNADVLKAILILTQAEIAYNSGDYDIAKQRANLAKTIAQGVTYMEGPPPEVDLVQVIGIIVGGLIVIGIVFTFISNFLEERKILLGG